MKKTAYWGVLFLVSMMNGAIFIIGSLAEMRKGIEGIDNQAGLLLIPALLWPAAAVVLTALNIGVLIAGGKIKKEECIDAFYIFKMDGVGTGTKIWRGVFLGICCLCMGIAVWMFSDKPLWAVMYALTGGLLLIMLYAWVASMASRG